MIFTNPRTSDNSRFNKQNINYNIRPMPVAMQIEPSHVVTNSISHNTVPKIDWGPSIWYFFHILAEKVQSTNFNIVRLELMNIIKLVSMNLPCPLCSTHAKSYLDKVNFSTILTKDDLKRMLLNFHNEVNKRLGKPEFTYSELTEKYSKGILNKIIPLFFKYFEDKHKSVRMLSNDMYTMRISHKIRSWLSENIVYFDN